MLHESLQRIRRVNLAEPHDLVMPRATAQVLKVLIGADSAFSIRQVARIAGITVPQALRVVNHESERGLVLVEQVGRSRMCRFNRDHLAANSVVELMSLRERMIRAVGDEIASWKIMPLHSSLFGSAARGDGGVDSDLDVLIVRPWEESTPQWDEQKYSSGLRLKRKIGNDISWFDVSLGELKTAKKASESIFLQWKKEGILLTGLPLLDLLGPAKAPSR